MTPSRAKPSQRYRDLVALYARMHREGEPTLKMAPAQTFDGGSLRQHLPAIRALIQASGARTLLDYGSGKGGLYDERPLRLPGGGEAPSLLDYWGLESFVRFDPGYAPFAERPAGTFDLVVCTDVLEHCPEEDLGWILAEVFGFARRAVYLCIAAYPAKKRLPSGENVHVTIKPAAWWVARLEQAADARPGLRWQAVVEEQSGGKVVARRIEGDPAAG